MQRPRCFSRFDDSFDVMLETFLIFTLGKRDQEAELHKKSLIFCWETEICLILNLAGLAVQFQVAGKRVSETM